MKQNFFTFLGMYSVTGYILKVSFTTLSGSERERERERETETERESESERESERL